MAKCMIAYVLYAVYKSAIYEQIVVADHTAIENIEMYVGNRIPIHKLLSPSRNSP